MKKKDQRQNGSVYWICPKCEIKNHIKTKIGIMGGHEISKANPCACGYERAKIRASSRLNSR